ncbi:MAG: hypothetical protein WCP29_17750 [Acidobacteriota bacterium]
MVRLFRVRLRRRVAVALAVLTIAPPAVFARQSIQGSAPIVASAQRRECAADLPGTCTAAAGTDARTHPSAPGAAAPSAPTAEPAKPKPSPLSRWFELQGATLLARYRRVETSTGVVTADQIQDSGQFKGRVKFDPAGHWTLNAGYATGNTFIGSWNNTGIGTGDRTNHWYLKQLYVGYTPVSGVEMSYGGMGFVRGESTEITTYDNDGYLAGERISVRLPKRLYLDEFGATRGYLGDITKPSVTNRFDRVFGGRNYDQIFATKKITKDVSVSGDYTRQSGVSYWHAAFAARTPAAKIVDSVRVERYTRAGTKPGTGFAVSGEKAVMTRVTVGFGYADIDPLAQTLNADKFARGKRVYETVSVKVASEWTVQVFWTQAVGNHIAIPIHRRLDIALAYNVLGGFRRLGWFR